MNLLTTEQKARLVWELAIDIENNPIFIALRITHGTEVSKNISNLLYKYEDSICDGSVKTLDNFISIFNEDLSMIDSSLLG